MPLEKISSEQAFSTARANAFSKYPHPESGAERLFPSPDPVCEPTFQISPHAKIFTIGSCFAREVDRALTKVGFDVISRSKELARVVDRTGNDESLYNKYTIHSILNEIRWALDPQHSYPGQHALVEVSDGKWDDPQLGGLSLSSKLGDLLVLRESYCKSMKRMVEADVLVITLGLVEAWYDKLSKLYLNGPPPLKTAKRNPERFELHVLDYQDIVEALEEVHVLVRQFGKPGVKFLVTVSPVPLLSTFRSQDVLVANTYSKSVLRAAVEKFVLNHDDVDYFPSYEFVTLGNPNENWSHDFRHVNPRLVDRIMSSVMTKYTPGDMTTSALISTKINAAYILKEYNEVITLSSQTELSLLQSTALYRVGLSRKRVGNLIEALEVFLLCVKKDGRHKEALENAIIMAIRTRNQSTAKECLKSHEDEFPELGDFRNKFALQINVTLD
jgi:hypothetical protein